MFSDKMFSIKNEIINNAFKQKIITILGIKIKFKTYDWYFEKNMERLDQICLKLATKDDIHQINNVKFYLPNYPVDIIQEIIADKQEFFEEKELKILDEYLSDNAIILDIGANIGNHTLYWLTTSKKNVQKVHSFEPIESTFEILKKNVELNNLQNKAILYDFGLSDENTSGKISVYGLSNIGSASLQKGEGGISLRRLDDVEINEERIDFMKIDVEGHEVQMLNGALETIKKYKPMIFIESFEKSFEEMNRILTSLGYKLEKEFAYSNYLYMPIR